MRSLVVFGAQEVTEEIAERYPAVTIDGMQARSGIVQTAEPAWDPTHPPHARGVLVQVGAFSCNYRDKGYILSLERQPSRAVFAIGSDFAGTVLATGPEVRTLEPGMRVIAQNHYTGIGQDADGVREGIATSSASKELQVFHENKLIRIPDRMTDEVAAGFSIGAQTAYSMVRKIAPKPGEKVLVTSATSNTSLSTLSVLRGRGARVYAATTSTAFDDRLKAAGADHVVRLEGETFREGTTVAALAQEIGGFDCVVDPYFDLHLERAVTVMAPFGRYTTCGLLAQNAHVAAAAGIGRMSAESIMIQVLTKNLAILGNCIGLRQDLQDAVDDYGRGALEWVVDSEFGGTDSAGFLQRTYNDRARFGKVVFRY